MPTTILEIIKLSLEISLKLITNMTPEQAKAFAERHEKNMAFWQKLFDRFDKTDEVPKTVRRPRRLGLASKRSTRTADAPAPPVSA